MLLDFLIDDELNTEFSGKIIWITYSPKQDHITREICKWTESYLRLTFHVDKCKNVVFNDGKQPLHNILWQCRTLLGIDFVVYVKPGVLMYYNLIEKIHRAIEDMFSESNDHLRETNGWGLIHDPEHDNFCILNHKHNDCFQGETKNDWIEKCSTEGLTVIEYKMSMNADNPDYDYDYNDLSTKNILSWREDFLKWTKTQADRKGFTDTFKDQMIFFGEDKKQDLFSYKLPNLVYYDGYKFTEDDLKQFENVNTFHTVEELEKLVMENRRDTLWIIGNKLIQPEGWWTVGYKKLYAISTILRTLLNSIVWAKMYDRTDMISSTIDNGMGTTGVYDI